MIDLGGTFRWVRDHPIEAALGAGGIAAAGYALYSLWRHWFAPQVPADDREEGVSIIIPTLNEEKALPELLESIARQKALVPFEVVVVDGGRTGPSTDRTVDVALEFASRGLDLQVVVGNALPGRARNIGAGHARHNHLLFLDADTALTRDDFLQVMVDSVRRDDVKLGFFSARYKSDSLSPDLQLMLAIGNLAYQVGQFPCGAHLYFRRAPFMWLGGFREDLGLGEDYELGRRALENGIKGRLLPLTVVWDERRVKKEGVWDIGRRYIANHLNFIGEKVGLSRTDDADRAYFDLDRQVR